MKYLYHPILSFSAPLLIVISLLGIFYREGTNKYQALPSLIVGTGLIASAALGRRRRREKLFYLIKKNNYLDN